MESTKKKEDKQVRLQQPCTGLPLVCVDDYKIEARARLPRSVHCYYSAGATAETTLKENSNAFNRWYILPRMLRDVSQRNMTTEVLGMRLQMPVAVSPTAMQKMAHPEGECASAKAAGSMGTVFTLSMASNSTIEEVAQAIPDSLKFFQTYLWRDSSLTEGLIRRAEAAGYRAIVVTIDSPIIGIRREENRRSFPLPPHLKLANMEEAYEDYKKKNKITMNSFEFGVYQFVQHNTWEHLKNITKLTSLPVVAKGVLTGEDARRAVNAGVAAVWVSNHGGRTVDGVPPTVEALPHVVAEVAGCCPVFVDGGFTQGTEVFKALALGANLVFVGRPVLWGLTCGGEEGVHHVLSIIRDELDNVMANTGCDSIQEIQNNMIVRKEIYAKL